VPDPDALTSLFRVVGSVGGLTSLIVGVFLGTLAGLMPGINGRAALLIALPLALGVDPVLGAVFLVALHSVVHTSSSIPAVLFGAPTSASEAATVIDGFPMARAGRGGEAVGAIIMSSMIGGLLGAAGLMALAPAAQTMIMMIGTPEVAALSVVGMLSIAALAGGGLAAGITVGAAGVLASTIGASVATGHPRFSFGWLELWDGVNVAAVVAGLFVVPELCARISATARPNIVLPGYRPVMEGCIASLRRWALLIRSSIIGFVVGFIPGIGASAAVWLAYGHATATEKSVPPFGAGAVAGVVAPEAANNSKEGGALVPTLFLGVPGTSGMAILLAAFSSLGIEVGPRLLTRDPGFVYVLGWTVVLANLIAAPACLIAAPWLVRFAVLSRQKIVPFGLVAALVAALLVNPGLSSVLQIVIFGLLGLALSATRLPRAPFLLGLVLGPLLESSLFKTGIIFGYAALLRPGVLAILAIALVIIVWAPRARAGGRRVVEPALGGGAYVLGFLALLFASAGAYSMSFSAMDRVAPLVACCVGVLAAGFAIILQRRAGTPFRGHVLDVDPALIASVGFFLVAAIWLDLWIAAALFVALATAFYARFSVWSSIGGAGIVAGLVWMIGG
jgi:putative tricarboxylic transport membrane protein